MAISTENIINYKNWKITMSAAPSRAYCVPVTLKDILFTEDSSGKWSYRYTEGVGAKLQHDVICYKTGMYTTTGAPAIVSENLIQTWLVNGIDLLAPKIDPRSIPEVIDCADLTIGGLSVNSTYYYDIKTRSLLKDKKFIKLYKPEAYIPYNKLSDALNNSASILSNVGGSKDIFSDDADDERLYVETTPFLASTFIPSSVATSIGYTADLYVFDKDTTFASQISSETEDTPYVTIAAGITNNIMTLVVKTLGLNNTSAVGASAFFSALALDVNNEEAPEKAEIVRKILENTYVYVKASFFGDYVDPKDFDQSLTRDSDVALRNIVVKKDLADTRKFSGSYDYSDEADSSQKTQAYVPQTLPLIDNLTKEVYKEVTGSYPSELTTDLTNVFNKLGEIGLPIGTMGIESVDEKYIDKYQKIKEDSDVPEFVPSMYPLGWLDPETAKTLDELIGENTERLPSMMHKEGNMALSGRIFCVTIDEITEALKKIINGRRADDDSTVITASDEGLPIGTGTSVNKEDTRLEEKEIIFTDAEGKTHKGDPIKSKLVQNKDTGTFERKVESFVNNNTAIKYTQYKSLNSMTDQMITFLNTTLKAVKKASSLCPFDVNGSITGDRVVVNTPISSGEWSPRVIPMSLRELEAATKQNKFNIISLVSFIKENIAVTGPAGKTHTNEYGNESAGSLYQLHKDYNMEVDNPNTFFNLAKENQTTDEGAGAVFEDGDYSTRYKEENYGKSLEGNEEKVNSYSAADCFMGADGKWHSVTEHVRLPIITSEW